MPAETHQCSDGLDAASVLTFLAEVIGAEAIDIAAAGRERAGEDAAGDGLAAVAATTLESVSVSDEMSILRLWELVIEEFGERAVGDPRTEDGETPPETLGALAARFADALGLVATVEIALDDASCPSCFNDVIDTLRQLPGVLDVDASITGRCIRVRHRGGEPAVIEAAATSGLRSTTKAGNEVVMGPADAHLAPGQCRHRPRVE